MNAGFFWLAASTGLLSLLTPCVFPMVPVTIAYFSRPEGNGNGRLRRPFLFGVGIIGTFTVLGLVLAAVFGAAGLNRFAADPTVNLVLAALFLVFAANLFGWIDMPAPWRLATAADRASRAQQPGSSLGALIMGATFTLTSVTCTAPFVGTLLVLASQGSWVMPLAGMFVYSTAFAVPFVALAFAPRLVARLPRAGEWMHSLRVLIGLLEVGAAVKFVSNADLVLGWAVFTRNVVLLSWAALAAIAAVYLGRKILQRDLRTEAALAGYAAVCATLALSTWLVSGIDGRTLAPIEAYLPPSSPLVVASTSSQPMSWMLNDYAGALNVARSSGKPVFVDFTGYTCTNCRWMEANIFSRPDVSAELGNFVLSRLYTDGDGEIYEQQQAFQEKNFGTVALPLYAVVGPDGKTRSTFSGLTRDPREFVAFLRSARARKLSAR